MIASKPTTETLPSTQSGEQGSDRCARFPRLASWDVAVPRSKTRVGKRRRRSSISAEENMTLARRFMEARVKGDVDALEAMLPPDFISHTKLLPEKQPAPKAMILASTTLVRK